MANLIYSNCFEGIETADIYGGPAMSDFQVDPLGDILAGEDVKSDWQREVIGNIAGNVSKIVHPQNIRDFPRFHLRYEDYIRRSKKLGETMFRISLDFARLCPKPYEFDEALMKTYIKILAEIRLQGQEPMLTLWHWPMPLYLTSYSKDGQIKTGGWEHPDANKHFKFFVESVMKYLSDEDKLEKVFRDNDFYDNEIKTLLSKNLVNHFITINEPSTFSFNGYFIGIFPPYRKASFKKLKKVINKLVQAHDDGYELIKKYLGNETKVGIAHNWTYFDGLLGGALQKYLNEALTKKFERDGSYSDFIALQYYCRVTFPAPYPPLWKIKPKDRHYGDHPGFGDVFPEGIFHLLKRLHEICPNKPIFITEFGAVDNSDRQRPYIIMETVRQILLAKAAGVPIQGILHWSLVHNFEWEQGMNCLLGLFHELALREPMVSDGKQLYGWEVWQAIITALKNPGPSQLKALDNFYERAKKQFFQNN